MAVEVRMPQLGESVHEGTVGRWLKAPMWLQTHGIDAWDCPARLVRAASERSELITTVSRYTKRRLLSWASIAPERVRVLPNTFRPMFAPGPKDRNLLARVGLANRKVILTVSRLSKSDQYKGHTLVIPKEPAETLDRLSDESAAAIGRVLPRICRAVMAATGTTEYNVLENNGPGAHQAVRHVHFHVIPKPNRNEGLGVSWPAGKLAQEAGATMAERIRAELAR